MLAGILTLLTGGIVGLAVALLGALIGGPAPKFGSKLKNKTVSSASYGNPWPRCRGHVRLTGNMLWSGNINETIHKTTSGGIFGVGQQSVYTYTYSINCAIGFGKKLQRIGASARDPLFGSATSFVRIYADGKLLYTAAVSDASGGGTIPDTSGSNNPVSDGLWPEGAYTIPVTAGPNGLKLSIGDEITFTWFLENGQAAPSGQAYEVQQPVNFAAGQSGVVSVFPALGPDPRSPDTDHSPIFLNIPGVGGPSTDVSSFDPDPHDGSHLAGGYIPGTGGITFYLGTDTQTPDPFMTSRLGAGNVPGYRGLTYCMIKDLELVNYGNRIPNISAEILFDPGPVALSEIVAALMTEPGYEPTQYDVSALTLTMIDGVEFDQEVYKESLHKLMALYLFDSAEVDGQIIFKFRDGLPVVSIPIDDVGALADTTTQEPRLTETLTDEQQVPETVWIRYYDPLKQFDQAAQYSKRISQPYASALLENPAVENSRLQITMDVPISQDGVTVRQQADKVLYSLWSDRFHATLKLPPKYIQLDPTDIIEIPYQNDFVLIRLAQVDRGAAWPLQLSGVSHDYHHSVATGGSGPGSGGSPPPADTPPGTVLVLLDCPFIEDADSHDVQDTGIYFALGTTLNTGLFFDVASHQWHGGTVYRSTDNVAFDQIGKTNVAAFRGVAKNILPAPTSAPWVFDDSHTLTVTWTGYDATLQIGPGQVPMTLTDSELTDGHENLAALIKGDGSLELLQFGHVTNNGDGTLTFSHLIRGVRGTETMAAGHAIGDVFVVLTGAEGHADLPLGDRNINRYYVALSDGLSPDFSMPTTEKTVSRDLMPYAPTQIGGYIDAFGNIIISWARRTRLGASNWAAGTIAAGGPLSEEFEEYEIDIKDPTGAYVLNTLKSNVPTLLYSRSMQTADFGGTVGSVKVSVYQMSATVGRGFPGNGQAPNSSPAATFGPDPYVITFDLGPGGVAVPDPTLTGQPFIAHRIASYVAGVFIPVGWDGSTIGCRKAPLGTYVVSIYWTPGDSSSPATHIADAIINAGQLTGTFAFLGFTSANSFTLEPGDLVEFFEVAPDKNISGLYCTASARRLNAQPATTGNIGL